MGSYANIKIGKYDFWWEKNGISDMEDWKEMKILIESLISIWN